MLAKVTRDRMMRADAPCYPPFDFEHNKGYPTPDPQGRPARLRPHRDPPQIVGVRRLAAARGELATRRSPSPTEAISRRAAPRQATRSQATWRDMGRRGRQATLTATGRQKRLAAGLGSFGMPSTRSETMLRSTSSVPPAIRIPGTPST